MRMMEATIQEYFAVAQKNKAELRINVISKRNPNSSGYYTFCGVVVKSIKGSYVTIEETEFTKGVVMFDIKEVKNKYLVFDGHDDDFGCFKIGKSPDGFLVKVNVDYSFATLD